MKKTQWKNIICLKFVGGDYSHGNFPIALKFDWNCCYSHLRLCWTFWYFVHGQGWVSWCWRIWLFQGFFCRGRKWFKRWILRQCLQFCFFWRSWSNPLDHFRTFKVVAYRSWGNQQWWYPCWVSGPRPVNLPYHWQYLQCRKSWSWWVWWFRQKKTCCFRHPLHQCSSAPSINWSISRSINWRSSWVLCSLRTICRSHRFAAWGSPF